MNSSVLLQTELQCVPTQWILVDCTPEHAVNKWLHELPDANFIDVLPVERFNISGSLKESYVQSRPLLLKRFSELYELGWVHCTVLAYCGSVKTGSRAREFPLDCANFCHWRHKFVPGVMRFSVGSDEDQRGFLAALSVQYFDMPSLEDTDAEGKKNDDIKIRSNPYDSCFVAPTLSPIQDLLQYILPLHSLETRFATRYRSEHLGSGGKLFLIENALVASASNWRRVDWLVLAQHNFFPRLWLLKDNTPHLTELMQLFDYRHWKARFEKLKENKSTEDIPLIDDLLGLETPKIKKADPNTELKRRRREKNWDHLPTKDLTSDKTFLRTRDPLFEEPNKYRITKGDFDTLKELILFMQKKEQFQLSLDSISLFGSARQPKFFSKLKGISLLQLGKTEDAIDLLKKYRLHILQDFEDARIITGKKDTEKEANVYSEVASIALLEDCCDVAREYAMKALELCPDLITALKTLTWASLKSGITSFSQEDLIFRFLLHQHTCGAISVQGTTGTVSSEIVEDYYQAVVSKYPKNAIYLYFYAVYQSLVSRDDTATEKNFNLALKGLPNNSRVLNSYATWLFQHSKYNPGHTERDREKWIKKLTTIEPLYRKALALADKEDANFVKSNFAAFLLCTANTLEKPEIIKKRRAPTTSHKFFYRDTSSSSSSDSSKSEENTQRRFEEGLDLLDQVLFSSEIESHPELAVECWFYAALYKLPRFLLESYQNLKTLLRAGNYALGWDFSAHVQHAQHNKHPDANWVDRLSKVVNNDARASCLIGWDRWTHVRCVGEGSRSAADIFGGASLEKRREEEGILFSTSYSKKSQKTHANDSPSPTQSPLRYSPAPLLKSPKEVSPYRPDRKSPKTTKAKRVLAKELAATAKIEASPSSTKVNKRKPESFLSDSESEKGVEEEKCSPKQMTKPLYSAKNNIKSLLNESESEAEKSTEKLKNKKKRDSGSEDFVEKNGMCMKNITSSDSDDESEDDDIFKQVKLSYTDKAKPKALIIDSDSEREGQKKNSDSGSDSESDSDSFISSITSTAKGKGSNKRNAEDAAESSPSKKQRVKKAVKQKQLQQKPRGRAKAGTAPTKKGQAQNIQNNQTAIKEEAQESDRASVRRFPGKKRKKSYEELSMEMGFGMAAGFFETDNVNKEDSSQKSRQNKWSKRQTPGLELVDKI